MSAVADKVLTHGKSWIQKTPGRCGGRACVRETRLAVWGLVCYRQLGASDEKLLATYPELSQDDLAAAWRYYAEHRPEIDADIRENEGA